MVTCAKPELKARIAKSKLSTTPGNITKVRQLKRCIVNPQIYYVATGKGSKIAAYIG